MGGASMQIAVEVPKDINLNIFSEKDKPKVVDINLGIYSIILEKSGLPQ